MAQRFRFLPLLLILAGVAVGLALHPSESPGQSAPSETAVPARGDARTGAALRIARRARKVARRAAAQVNSAEATAEQAQAAATAAAARLDDATVASDFQAGDASSQRLLWAAGRE